MVIIGAQKAGTTSLNNYINEHPEILGHHQTEFSYFLDDAEYAGNYSEVFNRYFTKGNNASSKRVVAKNVGIYTSDLAIARLHKHNPDCKLVFVLRDPVARAYSSYAMGKYRGWFKKDFSEIKDVIENGDTGGRVYKYFIELGLYANHLRTIYDFFPKEQVRVVLFEDLKKRPEVVCKEIFNWLQVDDSFVPSLSKKHNVSAKPKSKMLATTLNRLRKRRNIVNRLLRLVLPNRLYSRVGNYLMEFNKSEKREKPITQEMIQYLQRFYSPHNAELYELTGIDFSKIWKY